MDSSPLHQALIDHLKSAGNLRDPRVEAAFRAVPRHLFLPGVAVGQVYRDAAIITKRLDDQPVSSSSQPAIMALMLEQLDLRPGQRVLEIGAGTGYNAALMAYLVGDSGLVVTLDIDQDIVDSARQHLAAAGFDRVQAICRDGGGGYPEAAPYDRIVLTVGTPDIVPAWRAQLKPSGRLVLPLSIRLTQKSVAFDQAGGYLASASVADCSFMMLRGAFAGSRQSSQLGPEAGLHFIGDNPGLWDTGAIYLLLIGPSQDWPTTIQVTEQEIWGGLSLWLDLREAGFCHLWAEGEIAARGVVPRLFSFPGGRLAHGLVSKDSLCLLMRPPTDGPKESDDVPFELFVRNCGQNDTLARQLIEQVIAWDIAGRRGTDRLRIRAYPQDVEYQPAAHEMVVQKQWTQLVLDWQG